MTKQNLRLILNNIASRYFDTVPGGLGDHGVDDFVACLDNPNLEQHLIDTEIVPDFSEMKTELPKYQTAKGIISAYQEMFETLEFVGCVERKYPDLRVV